ncbi:AGE family epimerase/isomerase [Actinomyces ruminicola]|uniref:Mannose or cellobiose epimerase, N-acyl-D-glucosamine 2-epimerase family n=1 Tax=Actinomyces ruminicola TaxID=332524 RepID=A0A1G9S0E8_9ACTO|nr:AGE family epimerase/isomerase [Actinomyces ruminicola]SDM28979.1 Mannose or cellobiose epimerase, N-acyl-D-glucosamine 2-epimerase family [Actinomyces ruminicola]
MTTLTTRQLFDAQAWSLLAFGKRSRTAHGFGWLDDDGNIDANRGVHLWITGRMTHCFVLGHLMGDPDCLILAQHGVARLLDGPLRDTTTGAWLSAVDIDGAPRPGPLVSYDHSFLILAAASALMAEVPRARELLDAALLTFERLWWDEDAGMVVDSRDRETLAVDPYRGANANMHTVEALLAAYSATRDPLHLHRATRISGRIAQEVVSHGFRLPEHFDSSWHAVLDYNRDRPTDAFRPYGSTVGHWLEWSRLMIQLRTACSAAGIGYDPLLDSIPQRMYRQALQDGWGADGHQGFVYTVDFYGRPVAHERMYWVLCEAIGAAETLKQATGDASYEHDIDIYATFAREFLIEAPGRWREELDAHNRPSATTWSGKPDIYHALQAMLIGRLPITPSFAEGLLATGAAPA